MADNKNDSKPSAQQPAAKPEKAQSDTPSKDSKQQTKPAHTAAKTETKTKTDTKAESKAESKAGPQQKSTSPNAPKKPKEGKKGGGLAATLAVLALLGAGGAGGGVYWLWQQMDQQLRAQNQQAQSTVASIRSEMESLRSDIASSQQQLETEAKQSVNQAVEQLTAATGRQERNEKAQEALRASLEGLYARIGNTTRAWMLKEADYLLQIGNHRLQLERDLDTAAEALRLADSRIGAIGEPALLEVREAIASEIAALETFPAPDRIAMSLSLSELADRVTQLPLVGKVQPEQMLSDTEEAGKLEADSWENLPTAVWDAMKELVVVRVNDRPVEPLLPPEKVSFLYQNLQLKLEQARLALLQYDTELYQSNLHAAQQWIKDYYDTEAGDVQAVITKLDNLVTTNLAPALPDISGSLRMLRNVAARIKLDSGKVSSTAPNQTQTVASLAGGE